MLSALVFTVAFAVDDLPNAPIAALEWSPTSGTELRYRFDTSFQVAPERVGLDPVAHDAAVVIEAELEMSCLPTAGEGLKCVVMDAEVSSIDPSSDLARRVQATNDSLAGADVDIDMTETGRVLSVDVRTGDGLVWPHGPLLRTVVDLATSGLDLELPGPSGSPSSWMQQRSALLPETTTTSPLARIRLVHHARPSAMGLARIDTTGELAFLQTGRAFAVESTVKGDLVGAALFDTEQGVLMSREWTVRVPGASFVQVGRLQRL